MHHEIIEVVDFAGIGAEAEHDIAASRRTVAELAAIHVVGRPGRG